MKNLIPTAAETNLFMNEATCVSDIDYSYNAETGEYDIPAVEWESCYGRYWVTYENEAAREAALNSHKESFEQELLEWVAEYRARMKKEAIEKGRRIAAERRNLKEAKTLGGSFPILEKLRNELRTNA